MGLAEYYQRAENEFPKFCDDCPMRGQASGPIKGTASYGDTGTGDVMDVYNGHSSLLEVPSDQNASDIIELVKQCRGSEKSIVLRRDVCPALGEMAAGTIARHKYNRFWDKVAGI